MPVLPEWSPKPPQWSRNELDLFPSQIDDPPLTTLQTIIEKSDAYSSNFPVETGRCKTLKTLVDENILERNANSAYPFIHENILHLYVKYILHKRQYGNAIEKAIYDDVNLLQMIDRFLTKRAFVCHRDDNYYDLFDRDGCSLWEIIGTPEEKKPLVLEKCLSYEELKLSAFLSLSSYTHFVNIGGGESFDTYSEERDGIEDEGVIIGIVGPRLEKSEIMEYQELVITANQNTKEKGYGKTKKPNIHQLFANLYEEDCLIEFKDLKTRKKLPSNVQRYSPLKKGEVLDNFVYYKRLLFSLDALFAEANQRALEKNTTAYIQLVGIGLDSSMRRSECQNKIFMHSCRQRIKVLGKHLHNISDVCFTWMIPDPDEIEDDSSQPQDFKFEDSIPIEGHPLNEIKIHIPTKDEPHSRLAGSDQGKLLVVVYVLPDNKFWANYLGGMNDNNVAYCTQILELHDPFINPRICASNLRVVVGGKMIHIKEYVKEMKKRHRGNFK